MADKVFAFITDEKEARIDDLGDQLEAETISQEKYDELVDKEYEGYSEQTDAILKYLNDNDYRVNHDDHLAPTGNTKESTPHETPDVIVNYERGDEAHRDGVESFIVVEGQRAEQDTELMKLFDNYG